VAQEHGEFAEQEYLNPKPYTLHQAKEAKEGGEFAEQEYEKYRQAAKEAKENYELGLAKHKIEREEVRVSPLAPSR